MPYETTIVEWTIRDVGGVSMPAKEWLETHRSCAVGEWLYAHDYGRRVQTRPLYAGVDEDGDPIGSPVAYERKVVG